MKQEKGQILPMAAILLVAAMVGFGVLLSVVQTALSDEAMAQTAADAAALAGAAAGESAAEVAAKANGAILLEWKTVGSDAVVKARVGRSEAQARARRGGEVGESEPILAR